jgi:hypothetical protein
LIQLTRYEINRREELTLKLSDKTITREEAEELKMILEKEKEKAIEIDDMLALFAIHVLLMVIESYNRNR